MKRTLISAIAIIMFLSQVPAQDEFIPDQTGQTPTKEKQDKTDEQKKKEQEEKERQEKIKKYEEILKDSTKSEGPLTLYLKKKDVYLELDPSQLGRYWYIQGAFHTGASPFGVTAGFPIGRDFQAVDAFRLEKRDEEIWLYVPNLAWRWKSDDPMAKAAERSFPEGVLGSYKIEVEHPDTKKMLVKITDFFYGDLFDLNTIVMMSMGKPYQLDRSKTRVTSIEGYPENLVIHVDMYYTAGRMTMGGPEGFAGILGMGGKSHLADDRSLPFSVTYLLYPQKKSDYVPRLADPRVGYFVQQFFDHERFMELDRTTRLINRWNIKKKDPNAALSEPEKPIVWYIDDSVPRKWREACAEGILRWNKAFEKIGIRNAIVVKYKTEEDKWSHSDMRYNVLRFTDSEDAGYAVALFRTDPFTGEIVNASINVDANMVMYVGQEYTWIVNPATYSWSTLLKEVTLNEENKASQTLDVNNRPLPIWNLCTLGEGKLSSATFGWLALSALHPLSMSRDEYVKEFLADVVSHEMGHCLGLRHNFVGSTELSINELKNPNITKEKGISSSVMDYVPVNIAAVAQGKGDFYSKTIGTYDIFAIEYGYTDFGIKDPVKELPYLQKIAAKNGRPGHAFMTDENADLFDPYVVRFDISKNPLEAAETSIYVAKRLLEQADKRYPQKGKPYSDLARAVQIAMSQTFRNCLLASRFVGGLHGRRNFAGDENEQPTLVPVDPQLQRKALRIMVDNLLREDAFRLSDKILLNLSPDYNSEVYDEAPIKDMISSLQRAVVVRLISATTVRRVNNNAYKLRGKNGALTLPELYGAVVGNVFAEIGTGRKIGVLRRELQRFTLEGLITQAMAPPGGIEEDARVICWDTLARLQKRLASAKAEDEMTRIHLRDMKNRIDRVMKSIVATPR